MNPGQSYFNYVSGPVRSYAYAAFAQAYRVTYVADATRRAGRDLETRRNFRVIRHGIPASRLKQELERWTRSDARAHLGSRTTKSPSRWSGPYVHARGSLISSKQFELCPTHSKARVRVFIAGALGEISYAESIRAVIDEAGLGDRVTMSGRWRMSRSTSRPLTSTSVPHGSRALRAFSSRRWHLDCQSSAHRYLGYQRCR